MGCEYKVEKEGDFVYLYSTEIGSKIGLPNPRFILSKTPFKPKRLLLGFFNFLSRRSSYGY